MHGFQPTSVKTIKSKTSSEQKLPNAETSSVHSNSMSRKLQVTIEPSDTHYITKKSNQITLTISPGFMSADTSALSSIIYLLN